MTSYMYTHPTEPCMRAAAAFSYTHKRQRLSTGHLLTLAFPALQNGTIEAKEVCRMPG